MICDFDIVKEMIRIAAGEELSITQDDMTIKGHAIRVPDQRQRPVTFAPSPGLVEDYHAPGGLGVRVDSALYAGYQIPPYTTVWLPSSSYMGEPPGSADAPATHPRRDGDQRDIDNDPAAPVSGR